MFIDAVHANVCQGKAATDKSLEKYFISLFAPRMGVVV
jgi:hypothetical protein